MYSERRLSGLSGIVEDLPGLARREGGKAPTRPRGGRIRGRLPLLRWLVRPNQITAGGGKGHARRVVKSRALHDVSFEPKARRLSVGGRGH